eukprot:scaffold14022_cov108-Isochrysis_galbana.AAC.5
MPRQLYPHPRHRALASITGPKPYSQRYWTKPWPRHPTSHETSPYPQYTIKGRGDWQGNLPQVATTVRVISRSTPTCQWRRRLRGWR